MVLLYETGARVQELIDLCPADSMKWKRKEKQVFAMMLAVATLLSGCAPNGIVFRWSYTCDYT